MMVSGEDALRLLRKWFEERTPVKAFLVLEDSVADIIVSGFVTGLSDDGGILISDSSVEEEDSTKNHIRIDPRRATHFEYGEARDLGSVPEESRRYLAERHGASSLSIRFAGGCRLSIFEHQK
jgi:hypothetical protein